MTEKTASVNATTVSLTLITARKPAILSKRFTLDDDGTLQKHPGGMLTQGTAERRTVTIAEFCALLAGLGSAQALTFGVCGHPTAYVVAQKKLSKATGTLPIVARDRAHFTWPTGPGLLMLDYDPAKDGTPLTRKELLKALYAVWPDLQCSPHVWRESASSCIYRTDTGAELRGVMGQRIYVLVLDAQDIKRAGAALYARLWLAGHGRFDVSASGAFLDRNIIDGSVWQPERLDFAGGAQCGPGLEQRRTDPLLYNADAAFVDTRTLADLSPEEQAQLEALKAAAREAMQPASEAKRAEWIDERLKAVPNGKKKEMLEVFERAVRDKRLLGDFVLVAEKFGKVTVAQMLDNPDKYHGTRFADPLEPDYANDRRIAFVNLKAAGRPYLFSHAHGGQRFSLHRAMQTVRLEGGELQAISRKLLELMRLDYVVFARGSELARLTPTGEALPVTAEWLQWYLAGVARFEQWDGRAKKMKTVDCPLSLARSICALSGNWNLPTLEGVLTAPSMTATGRMIQEDGFDAGTGLYLHFPANETWWTIPEHPDPATVKAAATFLWKPFAAFPFVAEVDRGGFLAALLTALVRPLLPTAPGFLISAPVAGSGKTLLALCVAALTGATAGVSSAGRDEEELEKRLLTELRYFSRCIIFDNLARPLESESLCSFLTSQHYSGRLLGTNLNIAGRPVAMVLLTGNNPTIIGDLNRRLIRISIDPACEKPFDRRFDLDPLSYVQEHRLDLVSAGLTLVKAAMRSGYKHSGGRFASFEVWSDVIRNCVCWIAENRWLEVGDPTASVDKSFDADPETSRLKSLIFEWKRVFGKRGGTVAEAIRRAKDDSAFFDILNEVSGDRDRIPPRRLGNWIARHEGRIVDGNRFARCGDHHKTVLWTVQDGGFGGFRGSPDPTREKWQSDKFTEQGEKTLETLETPNCDLCINFTPNSLDPRNGPGTCETPHDGRHSKAPTDGAGCARFERITH